MLRLVALALLSLGALALGGCASSDPVTENDRPRESSIPWNRPQSWEGPGVYGSAMSPR